VRYIIAWKLCTTMRADDVTDTLELALVASGCDSAKVVHKPPNGTPILDADIRWKNLRPGRVRYVATR